MSSEVFSGHSDALRYLEERFTRAKSPVKLDVPDPRRNVFVIDGATKCFERDPAPRDHAPATLAEVVALANRFAEAGCKPVVWYGLDAVVLVIDDDGHRVETATMKLARSDVWAVLDTLRKGKPKFDPRAFVRLLRIDLAGTLLPSDLLVHVKKLKFTNGQTTTSDHGRGKESMGREINAEVATGAEIPEVVTLRAPVFKTAGEREQFPVRCAVEVDPFEGVLQLIPLPDELERVEQMALESIAARLGVGLSDGIPAYQGVA